jgi:hypothetical protein
VRAGVDVMSDGTLVASAPKIDRRRNDERCVMSALVYKNGTVSKVFMSHNHADKPFVRRLATDLAQGGADVWIDEIEMKVGDSLIGKISTGITESDFVVVVISQNSVTSPWVTQKLEIALTM